MTTKILLADDGSRYSRASAHFLARRLRPNPPVVIHDVTVVPPASPEISRPSALDSEPGSRNPTPSPHEWLQEQGYSVERTVVEGEPAPELLDRAPNYDLVVAGVKGRGAAPFFELGRVARALARSASVPVLLVRPPGAHAQPGAASQPFQILLTAAEDGEELTSFRQTWEPLRAKEVRTAVVRLHEGGVRTLESGDQPHRSQVLPGPGEIALERQLRATGTELLVLPRRLDATGPLAELARVARTLTWSAPCSVLLLPPSPNPDLAMSASSG